MSKRCYYEVLGVQRTVNDDGLKSAFRKLALKWHPDRNRGKVSSETRFKEINEAYEILKDPDKRAAYDRFGHAAFEQGGATRPQGFGAADFGASFSDLFEGIFGMSTAGGHANRSTDLRHDVQITLEDAFSGKTVRLRLPTSVTCDSCSGSGAKAGTRPKTCKECGGAGRIRFSRGLFTLERPVRAVTAMAGSSRLNVPPAWTRATSYKSARCRSIFRPALRMARASACLVKEKPASRAPRPATCTSTCRSFLTNFSNVRALIYCRVPISMVTAALGGEFEVGTIEGSKTRVKVREGTQSGVRFRLKEKGMPVLRALQTGDMYVEVFVETPQRLTRRQRELLSEFEKLSAQEKRPETASAA